MYEQQIHDYFNSKDIVKHGSVAQANKAKAVSKLQSYNRSA